MAYVIGDPGDTWYKQETNHPVEGASGPQRMDEVWFGAKSTYADFKDEYTFGQTHTDHDELILHEVVPKMSGTFGQARLVWINSAQAPDNNSPSGTPPPVGSTSRSMVSGELEIALELNKNYSNLWVDDKPGIEAFMSPGPTLVYKYVSDTFTFSENDLVKNVFKRSTAGAKPMGLDGNISYDNWLLWSREVSDEGGSIFVITSSWRWSPDDGWDDQIYDAAS
jgi:hypothetical protein